MHSYPAPDPQALLPPLLACLPAAFSSSRPPPALLPLLSPILRQRVHIHSLGASSSDSWLPLLCWNPQRAAKIPGVVEHLQLEAHPVSGEIEVPEIENIMYRRLDKETLQARFDMEEYGLLAIYVWVTGEEGGDGWRLAELRSLEDKDDDSEWHRSIGEAEENSAGSAPSRHFSSSTNNGYNNYTTQPPKEDEDDDDDYWASYDRTPGRTPARTPAKRSPAPPSLSTIQESARQRSKSELEYFAQYADVQPALDAHDPDEEGPAAGESTLHGDSLTKGLDQHQYEPDASNIGTDGFDSSFPPTYEPKPLTNGNGALIDTPHSELNHPRPASSASSMSGSVEKLEREAEQQSQAEIAIKKHISTDIKSLFRLARTAGIEREEFERIVRTELDCLSLLEMDE